MEVLEGLKTDALVVSHGNQRVRDGDTVSLLGIDDGDTDIAELLEHSRDATSGDAG